MFVLDTNVVSELRKAKSGKANADVVAWAESVETSHLFLSSITILELEQGVLKIERKDAAQGSIIRAWLNRQVLPAFKGRILSIDSAVALRCARLHLPDPQAERDSLIAATALVHGFIVVTRNVGDFAATGVSTLNPWRVEQ